MTQVIEIRKFPVCDAPRATWFGRLRAKLFGVPSPERTIPLGASSPHLMRDIGLAEDVRSNHLLREHAPFRF
jgi:hypothetical protein